VLEPFKQLWARWQGVSHRILDVQNMALIAIAYVVGVGPVALVMRLAGTRLLDNGPADPQARSYWLPRSGRPMSMDEANRQF
jgi:hypothetical protein